MLKQIVKDTFQSITRFNAIQDYRHRRCYQGWIRSGKPIPPPHAVKQMTVKKYAVKFGTCFFVETGTYLGDMVSEMIDIFEKIYSIELSTELYEKAKKKFFRYKHISILKGDSSNILPKILNDIKEPCLFWLDAHYSEGITARGEKKTPVVQEVEYILNHSIGDHVILIDDARCFTGEDDYPTLEELRQLISNKYPYHAFEVEDDIIRSHKV